MVEETYVFSSKAKGKLITIMVVGLVLTAFGIFGVSQGWWDPGKVDGHHAESHAVINENNWVADHHGDHEERHTDRHHAEGDHVDHEVHSGEGHGEHHGYSFWKRVKADLWHNSLYFIGISIIGVFFYAINYVAWAGWSASINRVFLSLGSYLPVGGIILIVVFFFTYHDIFHWTHDGIMEEGSSNYDAIIASKAWYLNFPFYIARMFVYIIGWIVFWLFMRQQAEREDLNGGLLHHNRLINLSAGFLVFFGVSSSMSAWDWAMSIDTHWFSTMFGWYVFASWFVSGLSAITLLVIGLKKAGYLKIVNAEHLHDLGKFMFAFSIFWTYVWFSQFILIWYSNIPEESVWFVERMYLNMGNYAPIFILNLVINFLFPFFFMMTRDAKRYPVLLQVAAVAILIGHWFDFYLMVMPGVLKEHGGLNLGNLFLELGIAMIFAGIFIFCVLLGLSRISLIPKNHPFIQESINHHT